MKSVPLILALVFPLLAQAQQSVTGPIGLDALTQLDQLPLLRQGM